MLATYSIAITFLSGRTTMSAPFRDHYSRNGTGTNRLPAPVYAHTQYQSLAGFGTATQKRGGTTFRTCFGDVGFVAKLDVSDLKKSIIWYEDNLLLEIADAYTTDSWTQLQVPNLPFVWFGLDQSGSPGTRGLRTHPRRGQHRLRP
jgi:hypothetical protein